MGAVYMADLVRDDADHLIGCFGLHQGAGVNEHVAAIEHERVERGSLMIRIEMLPWLRPAALMIGLA